MKILIIGHGRHGKDTVAEIIAEVFNSSFASSSYAACVHTIFPAIKDKYNYTTHEGCYADRSNHRQEWMDLITKYNTPDKSKLCKQILSENDMYVGMRCPLEYEASKHLFNFVVWVDRSAVLNADPTMQIPYDAETMLLISNNGDLAELKYNVLEKFQFIKFYKEAA